MTSATAGNLGTRLASALLIGAIFTVSCAAHFPDQPTHPDALTGHRFQSSSTMVGGYPYVNALDFYGDGLGIEGCNSTGFDLWSVTTGVLAVADGGAVVDSRLMPGRS